MDEYPSEDELFTIANWDFFAPNRSGYENYLAFMAYVKERWWLPDWGWDSPDNEPGKFYVSTGGWSGNESLIEAMEQNWLFWALCWEQSRKGGHFIFQLPQHESFKEVRDGEVGTTRTEAPQASTD